MMHYREYYVASCVVPVVLFFVVLFLFCFSLKKNRQMKEQTHKHKHWSALITTWSNELLTMPSFYISYLSTSKSVGSFHETLRVVITEKLTKKV